MERGDYLPVDAAVVDSETAESFDKKVGEMAVGAEERVKIFLSEGFGDEEEKLVGEG